MAKLTMGQKADRVLKLLLGLRNPRVVRYLASRGFSEADLEDGWRLLRNVAKVTFDALPPRDLDTSQLLELDSWENTWFPVASASLARRFPAVHSRVFLNLSQTDGAAVIMSVGTFVERVTALRDGDEMSQKAAKLLVERGITDAVLQEARTLLAQLGRPAEESPLPDLEAQRKESLAAEAEMWSWYLEWSQIARAVITERRLLRELGFLREGHVGSTEGEELEELEDELDTESAAPRPLAATSSGRGAAAGSGGAASIEVGMPGSNPFTE